MGGAGLPFTNHNHHNNTTNNNDINVENQNQECIVREQDRFMPIANVIRIMRKILPPHAKISDEAKETIQECVSEYISFVTGEANERCQREQRKTVTAEDVLWAMSKLGFDDYIEPLTLYLHRYREFDTSHAGGGGAGGCGGSQLHHSLCFKRPATAVDPPPPPPPPQPNVHMYPGHGSSAFHPLPHHHHPVAASYGHLPETIEFGGLHPHHHRRRGNSNGGASTSQPQTPSDSSHDHFATTRLHGSE